MNLITTYWFFEKLINDNLCLLYRGFFNDDILRKVMDLTEINIDGFDEFKKKKKRMLFLMAEGFQNIIKHGEKSANEKNKEENQDFFLTLNRENAFFISTGNLIENKNIEALKKHIVEVNRLDEQALKELHSYVMKHGSISDKGGAGLGLIAIARKSSHKLNYLFEKYKEDLSIYYSQILLKTSEEISDGEIDKLLPITESIGFHKKMISENIFMIHKGDFSQDSLLPKLEIIKKNLKVRNNESIAFKDFNSVLSIMLENINQRGLEYNGKKQGIFLLAKRDSQFMISTGNFIDKDKIGEFEKHLIELNKLKQEENLLETEENIFNLNEIARISITPLEYSFEKIDEKKFFFSLSVIV